MPNLFFESSEDSLVSKHGSSVVGYWQLNDTLSSYYGTPLANTLTGTSTSVDGMYRKCRSFNGTSNYLYRASTTIGNPGTGNITVSGWYNFNSSPYKMLACKGSSITQTPDTGWYFYGLDNTLYFNMRYGVNNGQYIGYDYTFSDNVWYHIAVSIDRSSKAAFYVNGQSIYSRSGTFASGLNITNTANLSLGKAVYIGTEYLSGKMQDVWIIMSALSDGDIYQLYRNLK